MADTAVVTEENRDQQIAKLLTGVQDLLGENGLPSLKNRIAELEKKAPDLAAMADIKRIAEEQERMKAGFEQIVNRVKNPKGNILPGSEDEEFSILRFIAGKKLGLSEVPEAAHEFEMHKQYVKRLSTKAAQQIGDDKLGGAWIPDQFAPEIVPGAYAESAFVAADPSTGRTNISVIDGITGGKYVIGKFEGGCVSYFVGERDTVTESAASTGNITLDPKQLACLVRISKIQERLAAPTAFERFLRTDIMRSMGEKLDFVIPYGIGANTPRGIVYDPDIWVYNVEDRSVVKGSGASAVTYNGAEFRVEEVPMMQLVLEEDKIALNNTNVTITSPRCIARLKIKRADAVSANDEKGVYLLGGIMSDAELTGVIGKNAKTPQIPSNRVAGSSVGGVAGTGGSTSTDVFNFNGSEVVLGRWFGIEFDTDNGKGVGFKNGEMYLMAMTGIDLGIRQPRAVVVAPNAKVR